MKLFWWLEVDSKLFDEVFWTRECWFAFLNWGFREDEIAPRGDDEALSCWWFNFKWFNDSEILSCPVYFIGILLI